MSVSDRPGRYAQEASDASTEALRPARFTDLLFQITTVSRCQTKMADQKAIVAL